MSSFVSEYLPQHEGLLPKWLLFVSLISVLNFIQAYTTLTFTRRVYSGTTNPSSSPSSTELQTSSTVSTSAASAFPNTSPVTPLSARTFGTWTMVQSIVRLYAAYNIDNSAIYQLAFWTYAIAWGHFMSEWVYFKTARWGAGLAGPVFVATGSLVWMVAQWGYYVQ